MNIGYRQVTGGIVFKRTLKQVVTMGGLLLVLAVVSSDSLAWGQEEIGRGVKIRVAPVYPELARRMKIIGVVKVQVTVAANGVVKDAKLVGGHPVLANAVLDAVRKWRFETGSGDTTGLLQFRFDSAQ
jgi:TonB family protein